MRIPLMKAVCSPKMGMSQRKPKKKITPIPQSNAWNAGRFEYAARSQKLKIWTGRAQYSSRYDSREFFRQ